VKQKGRKCREGKGKPLASTVLSEIPRKEMIRYRWKGEGRRVTETRENCDGIDQAEEQTERVRIERQRIPGMTKDRTASPSPSLWTEPIGACQDCN
jgi:hypothetical protein